MKTVGLVGKSGTGKSYQAISLCREKNIESIVDDGLFISGNRILAGISAKRQATKVGAIKTALFTNEEHRRETAEKIREIHPRTVLILGTSVNMIRRIAERLEIPEVSEMVRIEDITTEEERELADQQRHVLGKHVIPVPTFQLKRQFSGYFVDPLRILRGRGNRSVISEKSVVRPTYSYLGEYVISDRVISDIVLHLGEQMQSIYSVVRVAVDSSPEGIRIQVITLMYFGTRVVEAAKEFQKEIVKEVEMMTAFNIMAVDIEVRGLK